MPAACRENLQVPLLSQATGNDSSTSIGLSGHAKLVSSCTRNFSRGLKSRSGNIKQKPASCNKNRGGGGEDNFKWLDTKSDQIKTGNSNLLTSTMLEPENFFKFSDAPMIKEFRAAHQKQGSENDQKVLPPREEMHNEKPRCETFEDLLPEKSRVSIEDIWFLHRTSYCYGDSPVSSDIDDDNWEMEVQRIASKACPIRNFKPLQIEVPMATEVKLKPPKIPDIYFSDEEDNISEHMHNLKCINDEKRP